MYKYKNYNYWCCYRHMVEGEKTLKIIEKLSGSHKVFNQKIHIASCDVLLNCTQPMVKTELESFLCSIIHKSVFEAMYINLYGRPEFLYMPTITDVQFIKSIVKTIMNNVMYKIEFFPKTRENYMTPINYLKNIIPRLNTTTMGNDVTELKHFSPTENSNHGLSLTHGIDKLTMEKSKSTMTNNTSTKIHKIKLLKNHKDYWKYKKIYESIAK